MMLVMIFKLLAAQAWQEVEGEDGVVRKVRAREGSGDSSGTAGRKRKADGWCEIAGYWWQAKETFDIEGLLDKKVEQVTVGKVRTAP